jgi:type IV pilus assembly protein PilC
MMLFVGCMISWVMVFLMPKFKDIFLDYDVRLPRVTIALIEGADWLAMHLPGILVIVLLIVIGTVLMSVWTRRMSENGILIRIVASVRWALPITRPLDYGLGMGKVIRSMTLGIRSGAPSAFVETLPTVVSATNRLRIRLALFAQSISEGVAPHQAAKTANLGEVFVCALRMVERGEDPERVLGHAADYYEAIAFRWWHALAALSGPLVTLAMGVMVGFIAFALFMPLIALINAVSESL